MTKREVVKSVIAHKECGRVPYRIELAFDEEKIRPYFPGNDLNIEMGNFIYALDCPWWDWYNLPVSYHGFDAPEELPQTIGFGSYEALMERLRYVREKTDCYILIQIYGSHFEKAYSARGIENFLADMGYNKEFARNLLDIIIKKNLVMLENIVSIPEIDGIILGSDWGSQRNLLMSPDTWREMIAPGEQKEYDLIKQAGKDVWIHSCGDIQQIIPDLIDMGVDVLNPVQPEAMDIYELKRKYGDRITFWGGISTQLILPYGTADEVKAETEKVVSFMSKGGGYIAAPAQSIQDDVPVENVLALLDKLRFYGK